MSTPPDYVKTDWVDNTTPVDEARMDKLEAGVDVNRDAAIVNSGRLDLIEADFLAGGRLAAKAPVVTSDWNNAQSNGWYVSTGAAANAPAALSGATTLIGRVEVASTTLRTQTVWDTNSGGGNSVLAPAYQRRFSAGAWGPWNLATPAASSGGVDYKGAWGAGTAYAQGDVVLYQGREYIAVNPGTGNTPPAPSSYGNPVISLVTALPSSPFDGQEVDFTDSLTTPTFVWRLRYVAAAPTNKWKFVGGAPAVVEVATAETLASTNYGALATAGPSFTVPLLGDYLVTVGSLAKFASGAGTFETALHSFDVGGTAASDNDAAAGNTNNSTSRMLAVERTSLKQVLAAGTALVSKYRSTANTVSWQNRRMIVCPVAVS